MSKFSEYKERKLQDPEFKKEIEDFPSKNLPTTYELFEKYSDKRIVIFRSREEADKFLEEMV